MKIAVISHDKTAKKRIENKLQDPFFEPDKKSPEIIFVYGGDGSLLYSERQYPGTPKVALKGSTTSKTHFYDENLLDRIITAIRHKKYSIQEYSKLTAEYKCNRLEALNEIQVHNRHPFVAVRFSLYINEILKHENIVGDGALVSTPFGSTAYYQSTGGSAFEKGIGIGFNNPHGRTGNYTIPENSTVTIEIKRGEALLICDNDKKMILLKPEDKITIKKSKNVARFLRFPGLHM